MLIPLFAAIAPFLVWPIELLFPYPHIVEEVAKGILILFILEHRNLLTRVKLAVLAGFLFAFSESVLYFFNILLVGDIQTLFLRFLLTTPLHISTSLIILFSAIINKKLIIFGVIGAMILHYLYNQLVM